MTKIVKIRLQLVKDKNLTEDGVYGIASRNTHEFIQSNVGHVFYAIRADMNYYRLTHSDRIIHIYNAFEMKEETEMKTYPTAAESRHISETVETEADLNQLDNVFTNIKDATAIGNTETNFYSQKLRKQVVLKLIELGYKVIECDDPRDGYFVTITW